MSTTTRQLLLKAMQKLKTSSNTETSQLDAEVLLTHILGKPREWILAHPQYKLSQKQTSDYDLLLNRRIKNEPIAYITGNKEFYGLNFQVNNKVLIPRPETELLVEQAINYVCASEQNKNIIMIDVGTGSGNIIISLAKMIDQKSSPSTSQKKRLPDKKLIYFAIDTSIDALKIAKQNAQRHEVDEDITFLAGRFLNPIIENSELLAKASAIHGRSTHFSKLMIIANLPYLSENIYCYSSDSVKIYEPKNALLSGPDGLDHYRKLLNHIKTLVKFHGLSVAVFLEISPEQKTLITKEVKTHFPKVKMSFAPDLRGKTRSVKFEA